MATDQGTVISNHKAQQTLVGLVSGALAAMQLASNLRHLLVKRDLAYYRENNRGADHTRAKAANAGGDAKRIQDPVVPVVAPQVETALAYFTEIFLASYPIFPVVSKPDLIDAALQVETVLGESSIHFQWVRHFAMAIRDGIKYNLMAVEVEWAKENVYSLVDSSDPTSYLGVPKETIFEGSKIKRINPYNLILDLRCAPNEIHAKGDFVGYTELLTRMQLKQLFLDLDNTLTTNATAAFESSCGGGQMSNSGSSANYYVPDINPEAVRAAAAGGFSWLTWAGIDVQHKIKYSDMYEVTTLYARIIPKEVGISGKNSGMPQIYKLIVVNSSVLIYAERKSNAHNFLPIVVSQPIDDGLNYQTKSFSDQAQPYQEIATALYVSAVQSQRRKVYDRLIYNPQLINKADIDRADAVARIPVKTEAYGRALSEAVYQIPYRDEGISGILGFAREVVDMADVATGQNRVQRGQFQKGNKTRYEFDVTMNNGDSRPKLTALMLETCFFQPIKHILKSNILQYQPPANLLNRQQDKPVQINPADLRKLVWQFQVADGMLPTSKLVNVELFGQILQAAAAVPQMAAEWDLAGMFVYQLKLQGANWVDYFRRSPQQQQQFLSNVTPPPAPTSQ